MPSSIIIFTGQGSQQIGMGKDVDSAPGSRAVWDCACDIAGDDVRRLCWKGPMNKLAQTRYQQVAVTAVNLASWYALKTADALPDNPLLIGHSVGEYSALHAGGALDLETTFKAVHARAQWMEEQARLTDGAMSAVKGGAYAEIKERLERIGLAGQVVIANDNSPRQVVIAGETASVKAASAQLAEAGLPSVKLPVNGAWHSPLMAGMQAGFGALLDTLDIHMPSSPIIMNRSAREPATPDEIRHNLTAHVVETVRWRETIDHVLQRGHTQFLEIGPRKLLCALLADHGEAGANAQAIHCQQRLKETRAC